MSLGSEVCVALSLDAFTTASRPKRVLCGVSKILDALDAKDRQVLQSALDNPDVTHAAIEKVLAANGKKITQGTVSRHRRGGCTCGG